MLRRLWRWLWGEPEIDPLVETMRLLVQSNAKNNEMTMEMVTAMGEASQKQADVLNSYLKLFQTPGEPQRWKFDPVQQNEEELTAAGFPSDASEREQAEWVLDNLQDL